MGYSSSRWLVAVVVLAVITFNPPAPAEAISCTQALEFLMSCQSFLLGVGEISSNCCVGAQSLARATVLSADRKIVCQIPINDVSFKLNRYKNLESKALRPTKEGHSPGMGHGSPPSAPPQLNRYKNLESKALRPTKQGHSPGMGHGSPPGAPPQLNKEFGDQGFTVDKKKVIAQVWVSPPGTPPQLNKYKNMESKALRPMKEGHSLGMGHGSPPGAPPQLNRYKNLESKDLRPTKEGHSPGMDHGSPPGAPPQLNRYKNLESKALRPTKEGHSPGMGHGSPPGASPQLNRYKNLESKAFTADKTRS
ncbi:hypothetical protein Salat_0158300 [Sesamum alatum]|uniref:Uncharacterized protein n=1 Tax=Sesamum alatum TaxID=300844 RepID=A0AAE1YYW6_9LAMI|nr:hypothetical protein Salat_0158300 [Sesamum alatum]